MSYNHITYLLRIYFKYFYINKKACMGPKMQFKNLQANLQCKPY